MKTGSICVHYLCLRAQRLFVRIQVITWLYVGEEFVGKPAIIVDAFSRFLVPCLLRSTKSRLVEHFGINETRDTRLQISLPASQKNHIVTK